MNTPAEVSKEHCALWNKLYNLAEDECFGGDSSDAKAAQLIVDSEARACAELRAEVERLKRDYDYDHKCLHEVRERCELWKQRAERAEAELADERARLRQLALDACRAAAIAPLVWYPGGYYVNPNGLRKINKQQVDACVAAIDAAMKEENK